MPRSVRHRPKKVVKRASSAAAMQAADDLKKDMRALSSSLLMLSQKMKYVMRNEKILGRNLIVMNQKVKALAEKATGPGAGTAPAQVAELSAELQSAADTAEKNAAAISELQSALDSVKETYAKSAEVKEIKYVVDAINPLEFVTYKDVEGIVEQTLAAHKKGKKK